MLKPSKLLFNYLFWSLGVKLWFDTLECRPIKYSNVLIAGVKVKRIIVQLPILELIYKMFFFNSEPQEDFSGKGTYFKTNTRLSYGVVRMGAR